VAVVTDPSDYAEVLNEMQTNKGGISTTTSLRLACKAFCATSSYDANICEYLTRVTSGK